MQIELLAKTECNNSDFWDVCEDQNFSSDAGSQGEYLIEFAGRNCYQSWNNPAGRTNAEYIKNIIEHQHFSVLEHVSCTFFVTGVSRSFTHELIRHRHLSFSELSQRYVDVSNAEWVVPPIAKKDGVVSEEVWAAVHNAKDRYNIIQDELKNKELPRKRVNEAARCVLPNCIETKIVVTGNLRSWREVIEKRGAETADLEMRSFACQLFSILNEQYPSIFFDFGVYQAEDGFDAVLKFKGEDYTN